MNRLVVRRTKPPHIQRAIIVVMVSLRPVHSAYFAGLAHKLSATEGPLHRLVSGTLDRRNPTSC